MPSPYKDPDALRNQRRGVDPGRGAPAVRREPPPIPGGKEWPAWLVGWWTDVWTSPLTSEWNDLLDVQPAARLGDLYLAMRHEDEPSAALLAQVGRLESEMGLTPAARKRMHVKAAQAGPAAPEVPAKRRHLIATAEERADR